jgi:hypothetical protein
VYGDADAYVALYDAQAVRLHAYCWSLVGDRAAAAVHEVFAAAAYPDVMRRDAARDARAGLPPGGIWLFRRARAECLRRGPVTVISGRDPLLRAAARLRADQREALVLAADFAPADVAHVLAMPPARVVQLVTAARSRLERATLNLLLADPATARHEDIIGAFEKGTLGTLLARRAPAPPSGLREAVMDTFARERAPLVVISPPTKPAPDRDGAKARPAARHARAAAPVIGVAAACAAAVVGAVAAGATLDFDASPAGGGKGALAPSTVEYGRQGQAGQPAQGGQAARPGGGETSAPEVAPTASAAPRPIETGPGEAPYPASSNAPAAESSPADSQSPEASRQASSDPSQAADTERPSPSPSRSERPSPSESPSGGLLDDLPILGDVVGGVLSSPSGG